MMRTVLRVIAVMVFCVAGLATGRRDTALAAVTIQLEPVVTAGLDRPLYVTHAHDGSNRLFIVEQPGRIKVLQPGATSAATFLDITSLVLSGGERGLLGLAFHPQFPTNGRFFVDYTRRPDGATVVAEYGVSSSDPNVADPRETVLLTIPQPFENHNGGMIAFGPDGFLYIGMGDGGSANDPGNRAQNIDELLGKILRIDVDRPESSSKRYSSPPDNPFSGSIPGRTKSLPWACATPGVFPSTAQRGRSTRATSDRTRSRRSTSSRGAVITAGACSRGAAARIRGRRRVIQGVSSLPYSSILTRRGVAAS